MEDGRAKYLIGDEMIDFGQTRISLSRPLTSYSKIRGLISHLIRGKGIFISRKSIDKKTLLNIGSGPNAHPDFINLDSSWHPAIDICWDVTRGIPLPSEKMSGIFSEHCFEHLPFDNISAVLAECARVLSPGGTIRIIMPDPQLYLAGYVDLVSGESRSPLPYAERDKEGDLYSPIMSINRIFRSDGHLYLYDYDLIHKLLSRAGFVDIRRESFGQGRNQDLLIDTPSRTIESLYVEAVRPRDRAR